MLVPQLLLETLKDLNDHDFGEYKFFLGQKILKGCEKIPKCDLESPHRHHTVSKMVETYGEETAVKVTVAILRLMNHNNSAEQLEKTHRGTQEKVSPPPVTSTSAATLPTGQKISADGAANTNALKTQTSNCSVITSDFAACNVQCNFNCIIDYKVNMTIGGNVGGKVITSGNLANIVQNNVGGNVIISGNSGVNGGSDVITISNDGSVSTSGNVAGNERGNFGGLVCGNGNVIISGGGDFGGGVQPSNFHGFVTNHVKGDVGRNVRSFGKYGRESVMRETVNEIHHAPTVHYHYHYQDY